MRNAYRAYLKGQKVYSNFKLNFPYEHYTFANLVNTELKNCIVLMDEAQIYLNSRESMSKANREVTKKFITQCRKKNVTLFTSTQYPRQIDINIRSNSEMACFVTKYGYDPLRKKTYNVTQSRNFSKKIIMMIEVTMVRGDDGKSAKIRFKGNDIYNLYDTNETIDLSDFDKKQALDDKKAKDEKLYISEQPEKNIDAKNSPDKQKGIKEKKKKTPQKTARQKGRQSRKKKNKK